MTKEQDEYEELQRRLKVVFGLREKISNALDKLYTKANISPQDITNYLDNPKNFSPRQYDSIQKRRAQIQSFIWEALGEKEKKLEEGKKMTKKSKKRSRKSLGHRRKWLKMD